MALGDFSISQKRHESNRTLVTNFTKDRLTHFRNAITIYREQGGRADLDIRTTAYDLHGRPLKHYYSLHLLTVGSTLSEFWRIFESIRHE